MKRTILAVSIIFVVAACKTNPKTKTSLNTAQTHAGQMEAMFPKAKADIKTVGILLYDNYSIIDAMGPFQVFSDLMNAKVFFVGRHRGIITTAGGMKVQCDSSIQDVKHLDILVIPGGLKETYMASKDTTLLNWIKAIDLHSKYTTSVCTGAWILAATGLLKNKDATTHWYGKKILKDEFGINVKDERYVQSGKYWTSAGVSAGIDMSLALVNEIRGEDYTKLVMLDLEYDPKPPFKGGSEQNTDKDLVESARAMYNNMMDTVLNPRNTSGK